MNKKLVLFDIDGTLIRHVGEGSTKGWKPFMYAAKAVYGVSLNSPPTVSFHGLVDRQIFYTIVKEYGVSKEVFDSKFSLAASAMHEYASSQVRQKIYEAIPDAVFLLHLVYESPQTYYLGVLTGNVEKMAYWKLTHAGIDTSLFSLFVTSDEFEDRVSLAKSVFEKVKKEAGMVVSGEDTCVIGDAVGDVRCSHAIGATSIIATTGRHQKDELSKEHPTLLVDSLMDERVLKLLGLEG